MDSSDKAWEILSGRLGVRYKHARLSNYVCTGPSQTNVVGQVESYLRDFQARYESGQGVLFFGPPGTGKDHLMAAMMRAAVKASLSVRWDVGATLFCEFRDNMKGSVEEKQLIARYQDANIFAVSNPIPPSGGLSDYQADVFYRIVDRRYRERRPTWITINCKDRADAEKKLGVSIVDRLGHGAMSLPCNWPSYRQQGKA